MKKSQKWITENFEFLVSKYGGKYIGVIDEKVAAVALTPKEVKEIAAKMDIDEEDLSILKVPTEEELICIK